MGRYNTILFDFDGTIMNTAEGITRGVQNALERLGIMVEDRQTLLGFIGPPLLDAFMELYRLDEETARRGVTYYREYYKVRGLLECEPYPGIGALLKRLRDSGKTVALATSKPLHLAEDILRNTGLLTLFDVLSGADPDGAHGDKAEVIQYALSQCPAQDKSAAVMVGDRKYDIVGAKAVGLPCVAVLHGFGSRAEFEAADADFIAEDMAALEALLMA